jgi:hypothetical protein
MLALIIVFLARSQQQPTVLHNLPYSNEDLIEDSIEDLIEDLNKYSALSVIRRLE